MDATNKRHRLTNDQIMGALSDTRQQVQGSLCLKAQLFGVLLQVIALGGTA
jgi:hypothetical protein